MERLNLESLVVTGFVEKTAAGVTEEVELVERLVSSKQTDM
jgi:hypothetical protein